MNRFNRWIARRAARDDAALVAELVAAGRTPARPGWHLTRAFVVAAAVLVQIVALGSLALGAWLCVRHFPSYTLLPGVALLAFGVVLLPRPPGLPRYATRLHRRDAPHLFAFVDRVAERVGVPAPGLIVVDDRFAADGATTGVLRRRYLRLGAPLLAVLDADQRAAVVAHQLAHFDSGDPLRGGPAAAVDESLSALVLLFEPRPPATMRATNDPQLLRASLATGGFGKLGGVAADVWYAEVLLRPVLAVLQWLSVLVRLAVVGAARSDVHRAEYRADAVAAEVAGSAAALEAVSLLAAREPVLTVLRRHVRAGGSDRPDPEAWRALARSVLEHGVAESAPDASPFAGHPPPAYRMRLLRSLPDHPAPPRDDAGCAGVDAELAGEFRRMARDLRYG
ncbi:M48 family metalloprotease [Dactylosporangium sp. CA-139066]|uniref:M48 family metallopeptidase n=1 Tax=Dactylosporangium sp. CA-139066 TaxID=3239930 RepID=UPI003D93C3C2